MDIKAFFTHLPMEVINHITGLEKKLERALAKVALAEKIVKEVAVEIPKVMAVVHSAINEVPAIERIVADIKEFES